MVEHVPQALLVLVMLPAALRHHLHLSAQRAAQRHHLHPRQTTSVQQASTYAARTTQQDAVELVETVKQQEAVRCLPQQLSTRMALSLLLLLAQVLLLRQHHKVDRAQVLGTAVLQTSAATVVQMATSAASSVQRLHLESRESHRRSRRVPPHLCPSCRSGPWLWLHLPQVSL